jgi:hypothetical protein
LKHECSDTRYVWGRRRGSLKIWIGRTVFATDNSGRCGPEILAKERVAAAIGSDHIGFLPNHRRLSFTIDIKQYGIASGGWIVFQRRGRGPAGRRVKVQSRANGHRTGRAGMALDGWAGAGQAVEGEGVAIALDSHLDAARSLTAAGESHLDVQSLLRTTGVVGIGLISDQDDLHGVWTELIQAATIIRERIEVIVGDDIVAGDIDAHIDLTGGPAAVGRTRDVGLIPFHDDRDEVAWVDRRQCHRQRGGFRGAGGVEIQQILARRSRCRWQRIKNRSVIVIGQRAVVTGRREIRDPLCFDGIDRLRDDAVLEKMLIEKTNLVGDEFGAGNG